MHVAQRLLESFRGERVNDAFARLLAGEANAERRDVVGERAAATGAALVVAGDTGSLVVDRPEPVAFGRERVVDLPYVVEQPVARLGHRFIDDRRTETL